MTKCRYCKNSLTSYKHRLGCSAANIKRAVSKWSKDKLKNELPTKKCEHKNIKAGMMVNRCRDCGEFV